MRIFTLNANKSRSYLFVFGLFVANNRWHRNHSLAQLLVLAISLSFSGLSSAATKVAEESLLILDFELNDLTLNPLSEKENERVALLRPMLSEELKDKYGWTIQELDNGTRASAQKGKGYLFDRPHLSGDLGRTARARWVITGRLHKASYLFVYLKAQLIDTESLIVKADFVVEIKGAAPKLTRKGIDALALQISDTIKIMLANSTQ